MNQKTPKKSFGASAVSSATFQVAARATIVSGQVAEKKALYRVLECHILGHDPNPGSRRERQLHDAENIAQPRRTLYQDMVGSVLECLVPVFAQIVTGKHADGGMDSSRVQPAGKFKSVGLG